MSAANEPGARDREVPLVLDLARGSRVPRIELVQGSYYLATGLWPLVSPGTFQAVTGPKPELWLTKTVGVLATVVGSVLTYAGVRGRRPSELALLGLGTAAGFAAIDLVYASKRRISPVYFFD